MGNRKWGIVKGRLSRFPIFPFMICRLSIDSPSSIPDSPFPIPGFTTADRGANVTAAPGALRCSARFSPDHSLLPVPPTAPSEDCPCPKTKRTMAARVPRPKAVPSPGSGPRVASSNNSSRAAVLQQQEPSKTDTASKAVIRRSRRTGKRCGNGRTLGKVRPATARRICGPLDAIPTVAH